MKKIDWRTVKMYFILTLILCIIGGVIICIIYFEENYKLTNYFWIFNIAVICIIPMYYCIYSIIEKRKTKKIENTTIINNIDFKYYRDIIEGYSPSILSFILDGIELKKDFIASVIYLINKGYFKLTENNKIERTDKSCDNLAEDLQILCNNSKDMLCIPRTLFEEDRRKSMLKKQWFDSIEKGAVEKGLVIERKTWKQISFLSVICILEAIYSLVIENIGLTITSIFLILILMFIKFLGYDKNKWIKTQKGYDIYTKIMGLNNYIKDYSMLLDTDLNNVIIWEDYLIYAIIFNNTSKLNKSTSDFYKKICDAI